MTNTRTPVISAELATELADVIVAMGYDSPYSTMWDMPKDTEGNFRKVADLPVFADRNLPNFWALDVSEVLTARAAAARKAKLAAGIEAVETTDAIRAHLRAVFAAGERGFEMPKRYSLTYLRSLAASAEGRSHYRKNYRAAGTPTLALKLGEAVQYSYSQEAYADYVRYAVPFEGSVADAVQAKANLRDFCEAITTHTGWAGSGSNWEADLQDGFVVLTERASISD